MSVLVIAVTPGVDAEDYEQLTASLGLSDSLPEGCIAHFAGPSDGGWRVVTVWDSPEVVGEFARTQLGPAMAAAGFPLQPPEISPLHRVLLG